MIGAVVVVEAAWLALMIKLHMQEVALSRLSFFWLIVVLGPAITFPFYSTSPAVSRRLVEPSSGLEALYFLIGFAVLAVLFALLGYLAWAYAFLVAIPVGQMLIMRFCCRLFIQRHGRPPGDAPLIAPFIPSLVDFFLRGWRYQHQDIRYSALMAVLGMGPC